MKRLLRATLLLADHHLVAIWESRGGRLIPRVDSHAPDAGPARLIDVPTTYGVIGAALDTASGGIASTRDSQHPMGILPGPRRDEVVERPAAVELRVAIEEAPHILDLAPLDVVEAGLDTESDLGHGVRLRRCVRAFVRSCVRALRVRLRCR